MFEEDSVPKFLAVYPMPSQFTVEEATPLGKKAKALHTADTFWVQSWAQLNDQGKIVKIIFEWNGKDLKAVKNLVEKAGMSLEGVYPMRKVDFEDFR